jgi:hypothetical protein
MNKEIKQIQDFIRKRELSSGEYQDFVLLKDDVKTLIKMVAGMFECPNRHKKDLRESETGCEVCDLVDKIKSSF